MAKTWIKLYKYVPLTYAADILDHQRLYLSDGTNFNDPFEVTVTDRKNKTISHVDGLHILSLTNSYRNKLMWSHYAESHRGLCLTVRVPKSLVYPICYTSKRVYIDSDVDQIIDASKVKAKKQVVKPPHTFSREKKISYIKDRKWDYEKEYRIAFEKSEEKGLIFEDEKWYMSVKIENVYFGVAFSQNTEEAQQKVYEACRRNKTKTANMVLSQKNYSLNVRR